MDECIPQKQVTLSWKVVQYKPLQSGINGHILPRGPKAAGSKELTAAATVCTSICMSGGYLDDMDASELLPYTGAGMNDGLSTKLQYADQVLTFSDNKAWPLSTRSLCCLNMGVHL